VISLQEVDSLLVFECRGNLKRFLRSIMRASAQLILQFAKRHIQQKFRRLRFPSINEDNKITLGQYYLFNVLFSCSQNSLLLYSEYGSRLNVAFFNNHNSVHYSLRSYTEIGFVAYNVFRFPIQVSALCHLQTYLLFAGLG
jgi:hypothetical protein